MKTILRATIAAALFMLPGISAASSLDYEQSGSNYTVLFNPNGNTVNLPKSYFYRSYDCRIGSKPVVIPDLHIITPPANTGGTTPPTGGTTDTITPPDNGNGGTNPPVIPDGPTIPSGGGCDGNMASVPLPASSEMAGAGLVVIALASWRRSRIAAQA